MLSSQIKNTASLFILVLLAVLPRNTFSQKTAHDIVVAGAWPEVNRETKPWTRWWWMGNAVDKENLDFLLEEYKKTGFGGMEIALIYGAKGFEERYIDFLSEDWLEMLTYTVDKANQLGMGIDLTQGTGWPFGGPQVSVEHAASMFVFQEYQVPKGTKNLDIQNQKRKENEQIEKPLAAIGQFGSGEKKDLSAHLSEDQLVNLPSDLITVQVVYLGKTGQMVKRAAPGGAGFTLDHYSEAAVQAYLSSFDAAFQKDYPDFRAFYNDSFEVYGSDFTGLFFEEFQKKRGYDLRFFLSELKDDSGNSVARRVKSDYRETLHEMLLGKFTMHWRDWANDNGKLTKNQAHGSPGNLLDIYGAVDIPECETFGSSYFPIPGLRRDSADIRNVDPDPIVLKFASSAAHLTGKNLVSCETFTWLGEHFKSSFAQMKPELDQTFLAGVNHIFYHGVTYSPKDVPFPGWLFYASLNLTQHNSLWGHLPDFNQYITRTQSVLQAGKPDNELLLYWPVYDVWADPKGMMELITVHHIDHWLHPTQFYQQSKSLMDQGYSIDFISDQMIGKSKVQNGQILADPNSSPAKALLIPKMEFMPEQTLKNILALAEAGAKVIFQEKPSDVPGFNNLENRRIELQYLWKKTGLGNGKNQTEWGKGKLILSDNIAGSLAEEAVFGEPISETGLKFIKRQVGKDRYYFIVNHTGNTVSKSISFLSDAKNAILMNPLDGKIGTAKVEKNSKNLAIFLNLEPGESIIIRMTDENLGNIPTWNFPTQLVNSFGLDNDWNLTFGKDGGPFIPRDQKMEKPVSWTSNGDEQATYFSGKGTYKSRFDFDLNTELSYFLNFDKIHESAKVWINGQYAGQVWSLPYKLEISGLLKDGKNEIEIEVANLMANHIRYLDLQEIPWRNYHEINFVNIDYKPFDASTWKVMPSGLEGKVEIKGFKN